MESLPGQKLKTIFFAAELSRLKDWVHFQLPLFLAMWESTFDQSLDEVILDISLSLRLAKGYEDVPAVALEMDVGEDSGPADIGG